MSFSSFKSQAGVESTHPLCRRKGQPPKNWSVLLKVQGAWKPKKPNVATCTFEKSRKGLEMQERF